MDQFCFTKPYMSIIKTTQDQNKTPQKTTSFQKVKRSALPKYQPIYKSIYDDYVKLGLLSSPKALVFPSQSKLCIYRHMKVRVLQTQQCNSCALLREGRPCNHLHNQRHQTVPVSQHQLVSLAPVMSHHEVSHGQAVFHGTRMDICSTRSMFCQCKLVLLRTQLLSSSFVCRNPFPHPNAQ